MRTTDSRIRRVIESVAEVSAERDLDHLRRSLLLTLAEVMPVAAAGFDVLKTPPDDAATAGGFPWPPELAAQRDEILAQLAAGETVTLAADPSGGQLLGHAVSDEQALLVQLAQPEPEAQSVLHAFGRLYANFSTLLFESERDRLTGLRNRRSFDQHLERLTRELAMPLQRRGEAEHQPQRWWLALFDVDHFKRINDGFGHLYGDEVLLLLSRIVRQSFRGEDRCFRYGGEEFAVLLPRNDLSGATTALERLRQAVESFAFPQVGRVTISLGCTALEPRLAAAEAIDRADRALYAAKSGGRNRLISYEGLPARQPTAIESRGGSIELF